MERKSRRYTESFSTSSTTPKRGLLVALLLGIALVIAACGGGGPGAVGTVDSVSIDQPDQTIAVGAVRNLTATVDARDGASTEVDWSSSDSSVASVTAGGVLTGVAPGTATITATSRSHRNVSDSIAVTVQEGGGGGGGGQPDAPQITFSANPDSLEAGESTTLSWSIEGNFDSAEITDAIDQPVETDLPASGTAEVQVDSSQSYTLTVYYGGSYLTQESVTVTATPPAGHPTISNFSATVERGSRINFTWTGQDATSWELYAVGPGNVALSMDSGLGSNGDVTLPIPSSATPSYRLVLRNLAGETEYLLGRPSNVVISADDYDTYDAGVYTPEPAIPGTLRAVLAAAEPGSVIGFASDITHILLPGVGFHRPAGGPNSDAHLIIAKDVTISGPAGTRITLEGSSNQPAGDTSEALTWRSRVVFVAPGVTAELENLTLTGGEFIVAGAGINNAGNLTIRNVEVTGNRAFGDGGGIRNTGTMTIVDSEITANGAYTEDDEVGKTWIIRGSPDPRAVLTYGEAPLGNGGGIINRDTGVMEITNSTISGNSSYHSGGGIYNLGTLTMTDVNVVENSANFTIFEVPRWSYGGGIMNEGTLTITGGAINENEAAQQGGGIWHGAQANSTTLLNVNIGGNHAGLGGQAGYGGGIHHNYFPGEEGQLSMTGVTYTPANTPQNLLEREVPFPAGTVLHPLDYQMEPAKER